MVMIRSVVFRQRHKSLKDFQTTVASGIITRNFVSRSIIRENSRKPGALDAALKGKTIQGEGLKSSVQKSVEAEDKAKRILSRKSMYMNKPPPPIIPTPPPPPPRRGMKKYAWPITLIIVAAVGAFVYSRKDDEEEEFWKDVESGNILLDDDDEDEE